MNEWLDDWLLTHKDGDLPPPTGDFNLIFKRITSFLPLLDIYWTLFYLKDYLFYSSIYKGIKKNNWKKSIKRGRYCP